MTTKNDPRFIQTVKGLGEPITIALGDIRSGRDAHGYYDPSTMGITIGEHVPAPLRHVILLHEAMHLVDAQLIGAGVTKRQIPHEYINCGAPLLLAFLTQAGFWRNGPTLRELDTAMRAEHRKDVRRAAQRQGKGSP